MLLNNKLPSDGMINLLIMIDLQEKRKISFDILTISTTMRGPNLNRGSAETRNEVAEVTLTFS